MNKYKIFETNEFIKHLEKIQKRDLIFITNKLADYIYPQLKDEPHYGKNIKKLSGYDPDTWRYRIGKYRLFYAVDEDEKIIYLLSLELRKDAY